MSDITIQVTGQRKIEDVLKKTVSAVKTGGREVTDMMGLKAVIIARQKAPVGVRTANKSLRNAITFRTSQEAKGYQARVWVKTSNNNARIALANEFGVKKRKYYIGQNTSNEALREWVRKKMGRNPDQLKYITVGGPKTVLGRKNKFWKPSYDTLRSQTPQIVAKTLGRRIERAIN